MQRRRAKLFSEESSSSSEVACCDREAHTIRGIPQASQYLFEAFWQSEELLSFGTVKMWWRLESFALQIVEDLHSRHLNSS